MFFHYINLGCKVNQIESEQIAQKLIKQGFTFSPDINDSDFLVINTCTVTQKADKKSLSTIKKYNRYPNLKNIFITGCYSELEKNLKKKLPAKNTIIAQNQKNQLSLIIDQMLRKKLGYLEHIPHYQNKWEAFKSSRVFTHNLNNNQSNFLKYQRAFIKIQDGCNAFCTYCRIPFARGAPVSRDSQNIIQQIKKLEKKKCPEIVLAGINIGTYFDKEKKISFGQLVKKLLTICEFSKIRISSLEPQSIKEDFLECLKHKNLIPHLHLPLQGISNRILKEMNRRYTLTDYEKIITTIKKDNPYFSISTDIIIGFPDETEEEFKQGIKFLKKMEFSKLHVFPFSFRPLTVLDAQKKSGQRIPLPTNIIKERVTFLNKLSNSWHIEKAFQFKQKKIIQRFVIEEEINPLTDFIALPYQKKLPFDYPVEKHVFLKGTTDYYMKGILPLKKDSFPLFPSLLRSSQLLGKVIPVKINTSHPLIFQSQEKKILD